MSSRWDPPKPSPGATDGGHDFRPDHLYGGAFGWDGHRLVEKCSNCGGTREVEITEEQRSTTFRNFSKTAGVWWPEHAKVCPGTGPSGKTGITEGGASGPTGKTGLGPTGKTGLTGGEGPTIDVDRLVEILELAEIVRGDGVA